MTGLSPEEEAERRQQNSDADADGALKLLPISIPTEWKVVQVCKEERRGEETSGPCLCLAFNTVAAVYRWYVAP